MPALRLRVQLGTSVKPAILGAGCQSRHCTDTRTNRRVFEPVAAAKPAESALVRPSGTKKGLPAHGGCRGAETPELRWEKVTGGVAVYGDVNGDGKADFALTLRQITKVAKDDFML